MFWYRLLSFFRGYLVLIVRGESLVKFVNLATANGVYLWDIRRYGRDMLQVKTGIQGLRILRPLLRKTGCRCRIRVRRGVPFLTGRVLQRPFWLLGLGMAVLLTSYLSSLVLFIRIEGVGDPRGVLRRELSSYGVVPGVNRGRIMNRMEQIERAVRINHPEFLWVDLRIRGVLLELQVVRRAVAPHCAGPAELVAAKDGRITRLTVIQGTPLAKEGDTVARGDSLIAGFQMMKDLNGQAILKRVEAKGRIEAVVGYDAVVDEPLSIWECRPTGRRKITLFLRWRGRLTPIFSWGEAKGQVFRALSRKTLKSGRNPRSLVELILDKSVEVQWTRRLVPVARALAEARRASKMKLLQEMPAGSRPLRVWEEWCVEGDFLNYRRTAEVVEEIGAPVRKE